MNKKSRYTGKKPFSMGYVLRATMAYMLRDINTSIDKTFERVEEFAGDQDKSQEVFQTLSFLHQMRKTLNEFESANINYFKSE